MLLLIVVGAVLSPLQASVFIDPIVIDLEIVVHRPAAIGLELAEGNAFLGLRFLGRS